MILSIVTGRKNTILHTHSASVKKIDAPIKKLIQDMIDTMSEAKGLGIAAPQVGVNLRLVIVRMNYNTDHEMWIPMINPEIISYSQEEEEKEEGCLSIPGKFGKTLRAKSITVTFTDKRWKKQTFHLDSLNAHIMQHEVDHINGILFVDRLIGELTESSTTERVQINKERKRQTNVDTRNT